MSDELNDLLKQLDEEQPISTALAPIEPKAPADDEPLRPRQTLIAEPLGPATKHEIADEDGAPDYGAIIKRFDKGFDLVADRIAVDRERQLAVLHILFERMQAGAATDIETESTVKLLDTMAATSSNYVKLLDSQSKLVAATKPAFVINNQQAVSTSSEDLIKALQQPEATDGA